MNENMKLVFEQLDEMEQLFFKLGHIHSIASMLAENVPNNNESSVAWAIADMTKELEDKLFEKYERMLMGYRMVLADLEPKKAKKK